MRESDEWLGHVQVERLVHVQSNPWLARAACMVLDLGRAELQAHVLVWRAAGVEPEGGCGVGSSRATPGIRAHEHDRLCSRERDGDAMRTPCAVR